MVVMSRYLNQTAEYTPIVQPIVLDAYGEPAYGASRTIRVREELEEKEVYSTGGELIKSSLQYYVGEKLLVGSKLNGRKIQEVEPYRGLGGRVYGYRVFV